MLFRSLPHPHAFQYTANDHLLAVAASTVGPYARVPHTGDTVESVIGAVHLDGGYQSAAEIGVRLCLPHAGDQILDASKATDKELAWIGRQAIDAFVTEREVRRRLPQWPSQKTLHRIRSGSQLRDVGPTSGPYADRMDAAAMAIGTAMATTGWDAAMRECATHIAARDERSTSGR